MSMYRVTADDWRDEWMSRLLRDSRRRAKAAREGQERPGDHKIRAEREYDEETENLRRFLAGQKDVAA